MIPLCVIAGPTASGKTALAVALCQQFDGEVISADSMQVYAGLRIGTARPTEEEMAGVPHHLLGFLPPQASFSVARYAEAAHEAIRAVHARGRLPVLCGGTGLYIQTVVENRRFEEQPAQRPMREELIRRAEREGTEVLLAELATVDPPTAARLHPNDRGRIVRALELYYTTGRTVTQQNEESHRVPSPYAVCGLRLEFHDRALLYDRINRRVDAMMDEGLEAEARWLRDQPDTDTVCQAIGYKEWAPYFAGEQSRDEVAEAIKQSSRRYAKRQLSWFRRDSGLKPLFADDGTVLAEATAEIKRWKECGCR